MLAMRVSFLALVFFCLFANSWAFAREHTGGEVLYAGATYEVGEFVGSGKFASVYAVKNKPGMAIKIFRPARDDKELETYQKLLNSAPVIEQLYDGSSGSLGILKVQALRKAIYTSAQHERAEVLVSVAELAQEESLLEAGAIQLSRSKLRHYNDEVGRIILAQHKIFKSLAAGSLMHLTSYGVSHGDIKPENILFVGGRGKKLKVTPEVILDDTLHVVLGDLEQVEDDPPVTTQLYEPLERKQRFSMPVSDQYMLAVTLAVVQGYRVSEGADEQQEDSGSANAEQNIEKILAPIIDHMEMNRIASAAIPDLKVRAAQLELLDYFDAASAKDHKTRLAGLIDLAKQNKFLPKIFPRVYQLPNPRVSLWNQITQTTCSVLDWVRTAVGTGNVQQNRREYFEVNPKW